jgi:hypothetical protein
LEVSSYEEQQEDNDAVTLSETSNEENEAVPENVTAILPHNQTPTLRSTQVAVDKKAVPIKDDAPRGKKRCFSNYQPVKDFANNLNVQMSRL